VLNADDPRVLRSRRHPGRSVTFGFSEGADVRAENVEFGAAARASALSEWILKRDVRPARGHEPAGRHRRGARLRDRAGAPARNAVASFAAGNMRGERSEHNGIVVWNDCYNSNPEAAQSMIDVLRETPAAGALRCLGEMLELGARRRRAAPAGGPVRGGTWVDC
jgi:UDP-N-acetylmuramoyl-tripeptide--D-alanyl-D-alanine ligase